MRRRESNHNGIVIQILLILSIVVGLTMTSLGAVFRVYVCHWVAKVLFACWIGVFVVATAAIGLCTRISQEYGPRYGPVLYFTFSVVNFILCFVMVACLCFSMKDFDRDKWFRPGAPFLVVDPDHCVVERYSYDYYYTKVIQKHGRMGLRYGSVLIAIGCLEMCLTLLKCLFIGQLRGYFGATDKQRREMMHLEGRKGNAQAV
ncbi:uncharacterized protein LOC124457828 [Xenia sp. Carnegie-2017]|uniref:uncharacterized protein LOC124457828 n=1 Tax=Xenia sp. Carnegie-2017 TaxID=2897299 RepID=UPI001F03A3D7|nr:uncharacterized protein LOC124457828 [Xenia sp. Carnegie-2017]XP_046863980.1 uncharacterized protein LOC124457828 [Xenia sp. Carnegie-2017]